MRPGLWEEWLVFMMHEPVGSYAADHRLAFLLSTLSNTIGGGKRTGKEGKTVVAWKPAEFLPKYGVLGEDAAREPAAKKPKRMTADETAEYVAGIMASFGGKDPAHSGAQTAARVPRFTRTR